MAQKPSARLGIVRYLTLKPEANAILERRAVGPKDQGRFLSRLLEQEEERLLEEEYRQLAVKRLRREVGSLRDVE